MNERSPILKTPGAVKALLEAHDHPEKANMLNVYVCTQCNHDAIYLYLDTGVTAAIMNCPNCKSEGTFMSSGGTRQPDILWYRPKNLDEIKEIVDAYVASDKENVDKQITEQKTCMKEFKGMILKNYIIHYNQGGLFSKKRV